MGEYITQILNMDNLSEEQKSALLENIANELIEKKENIQEDPMAKHDMVAEKNRKHTEELRKKIKGYEEKHRKEEEERLRNLSLEEKLSKLATLKNKLGEPVYTKKDLKSMTGFEIEHLYSTVFEKNNIVDNNEKVLDDNTDKYVDVEKLKEKLRSVKSSDEKNSIDGIEEPKENIAEEVNNEGRLTIANPKKMPNKIVNIPSGIRENNGEFHVVNEPSMNNEVVNVFPGTLEELRACSGLEPEEKPRKRVAKIASLLTNLKEKIVNKFKAFIEKRRANKEQFNVSANEDSDVVDRLVSCTSEQELKAVSR